ncbi:MAG: radical SAM protein, partial [Terriglobia bacterium]
MPTLGESAPVDTNSYLSPERDYPVPMSATCQSHLKGLTFLWLEITPHCNLHCQHCYVSSSPRLQDPMVVDWQLVLHQAREAGCRSVQFIGGEPMSNPRLLDYLAEAHKLDYRFIEIYTNLTLLTDRVARQFSSYGTNIATSFYSFRRETHERITGVRGSFDRTLAGIDRALSASLPLRVGIINTGMNDSEVQESIEFLAGRGVDRNWIHTDKTRPVGRGADLTPSESLQKTLCGHCWRGKLCVTAHGACYPCVFARNLTAGSVLTQNVSTIVESQELLGFRNLIYETFRTHPTDHHSERHDRECVPESCVPCSPAGCKPAECTPIGGCDPSCAPPCNPDRP